MHDYQMLYVGSFLNAWTYDTKVSGHAIYNIVA